MRLVAQIVFKFHLLFLNLHTYIGRHSLSWYSSKTIVIRGRYIKVISGKEL